MQVITFYLRQINNKTLAQKMFVTNERKICAQKEFTCLTLNASCHNITIVNYVGLGTNVTTLRRTKLEVYYTKNKLEKLS